MKFLLIANFKSNKTSAEVESWVSEVSVVAKSAPDLKIIVAPSFPHLDLINRLTDSQITLASQDVSPFPYGSYTGAVNAAQLADLDVSYGIIGHSERRRYFHETHQEVANKASELISSGITPILCMDKGDISGLFAALEVDKSKLIFAFEPVGDIGGSVTAPIDEIKDVLSQIKKISPQSPVIYGGSVNAGNIATLYGVADGALVASASFDPSSFKNIINALS